MSLALCMTIALIGGTVHQADGPPLVGATILIENNLIVAVGTDIAIPDGARKISVRGSVITPGFIDAWTQLGLVEIWGVGATNDTGGGQGLIRAAQKVTDSYNPDSTVIPIQRAHGVTTVMAVPGGGLISGQPSVWDLGPAKPIRRHVGLVGGLGGINEGSRGDRFLKLREAFDDAAAYAKNRVRFEQNRFRKVSASRLDLEAMGPVIRGEQPIFFAVNRRADINAVVGWAQEKRVKLILVGAREAWLEADRLAAAGIGVILDPSANAPTNFDSLRSRGDAAVILHRAGVSLAISSFSTHNVRKLRQWAGNAVRAGLPHAEALKAVTLGPARLLGLNKRGSIAAGMVANLVVWSGDPFEFSTEVRSVYIGGVAQPQDHRQKALFRRYRR